MLGIFTRLIVELGELSLTDEAFMVYDSTMIAQITDLLIL
jgi:hypothetical protein